MAKKYNILIGGKFRQTERELAVVSPYDGKAVGTTYLAGDKELNEAVTAAESAFVVLKGLPSYKKAEVIQKVVEGLKKREEELAKVIALEAGKPIKDARGEARRAQNTFQIAAEEAKRLGGEVIPLDIMAGSEGRFGIVRRFPVGVVLGITPFNFPLNLVAHKVAPSMACGNPIIIKPASKTPLSAIILGEIITEAGWPDGGVNVVPCPATDAEKIIGDDRIKKITFTGSAVVGWALKAKAATKKITLELGGNAGVIIHEDADLDFAAKRCTVGAFSYAGQICISIQRIYAHRNIFDKFRDAYLENCRKLKSGDPLEETTDIGPMIEEAAAVRTEDWIKEAVGEGAKVLLGGKRKGGFMEPTVLTNT
ncbi:MAG: aldehyde dehydrogenase family protein, partial [Deltaproteobacteria bacterium]|nr:aldehyde dehydrogenase family protein [Deltaproteobacteria bacterium]